MLNNRIKINCRKVYDSGEFYEKYSNDIKDIQKELTKLSDEINEIWGGVDGDNFAKSLENHNKEFNAVVNFLDFNGDLLKRSALEHGNIDNVFTEKVERSDLDERK